MSPRLLEFARFNGSVCCSDFGPVGVFPELINLTNFTFCREKSDYLVKLKSIGSFWLTSGYRKLDLRQPSETNLIYVFGYV